MDEHTHYLIEALRNCVGTLKLILEQDEVCELMESIQLDEGVTLMSCVTGSLTELNDVMNGQPW